MARKKICLINQAEAELLAQGQNISCKNHRHMSPREIDKYTGSTEVRPWLVDAGAGYKAIAQWATLPNGKPSKRYLVLMQDRVWRAVISGCTTTMQWVPAGGQGRTTGNPYKIRCQDRNTARCQSSVNGKSFHEWKKDLEREAHNTGNPEIIEKAKKLDSRVWKHLWVTGAPPTFEP